MSEASRGSTPVEPGAPRSRTPNAARPVCIVTGGGRGIGRALARELGRRGAHVVIVGRNAAAGDDLVNAIGAESGAPADFVRCDLASQANIRLLVPHLLERFPRVHALINNAGVYSLRSRKSVDGVELTMAVNYLAPVLLTRLMLPSLLATAPTRIINVVSRMERYSTGDISDTSRWLHGTTFGLLPYARSKRALLHFTRDLATRLRDTGVTVNAVHPGFVATDLLRDLPRLVRWIYEPFLLSPDQSASFMGALVMSPEYSSVTGALFVPGPRESAGSSASRRMSAQQALWSATARMLNLPD
jgi:retinol dehydrogenase 12